MCGRGWAGKPGHREPWRTGDSPLWHRGATEGFAERSGTEWPFFRMRTLAGVAWQDQGNRTDVRRTTEEAALPGKDDEGLK